jgi:DNA repair protein RadD
MQTTLFKPPPARALTLRPYQGEAVRNVYAFLRARSDNPCVVIPTAGGKTAIIATLCRDVAREWGGRALILSHVQELVAQSAAELAAICPDVPTGVYSAGLKSRDTAQPIISAGIQSVYRRACDLDAFNLIVIDEAHLIPPDGDGMYRQFINDAQKINPRVRIVGLTATPFRLSSGPICAPANILNEICYEVGVRELIVGGFISALRTPSVDTKIDVSGVHVRGGEYRPDELEAAFNDDAVVRAACAEIITRTAERQSVLIFTAGIRHGEHVAKTLAEMSDQRCEFVCDETATGQREAALADFAVGRLKYLANVNILTTGYNCPRIDCVSLLRSTLSPGLYYQMIGRGFRLSPETGKTNCLVLDFGGNIKTHGPVDMLRVPGERSTRADDGAPVSKECPQCKEIISAGFSRCPQCGYEFPPPDRDQHGRTAARGGVLSDDIPTVRHEIIETTYGVHVGKSGVPLMRVDYNYGAGRRDCVCDWICVEHDGWPRDKAVAWWRERSPDPAPVTAEAAVFAANNGALRDTYAVLVKYPPGKKFPEFVGYEFGPMPEPLGAADLEPPPEQQPAIEFTDAPQPAAFISDEEIPF